MHGWAAMPTVGHVLAPPSVTERSLTGHTWVESQGPSLTDQLVAAQRPVESRAWPDAHFRCPPQVWPAVSGYVHAPEKHTRFGAQSHS